MEQSYIDIHKHQGIEEFDTDIFTIFNCHEMFSSIAAERHYSLGIHPWYINETENQIAYLRGAAMQSNVIAIGECGMDALKGAPMKLQVEIFQQQILLANEYNKPLIIHCVRAFPQTLSLLKQAKIPVVFHGFNKKMSIANDILKQGYYLSFGADLLKSHSAAYAVFASIPSNRYFFETDDATISIKKIYEAGSKIRKTGEDAIILQVQENFKTVFNL